MKIAMFTDTYKPQINGVVTHIEEISNFFVKRGHKITIFAPGTGKFKIRKLSTNFEIVKVWSIPFYLYKGYRIPMTRLKNISKIFEEEPFDIIHIQTPAIMGIIGSLMSKRFSIPIVGTYHTLLPEFFPYITKGKFQDIIKKLSGHPVNRYTKFVYSRLNYTIVPSNEIKKYIESCGVKNVVCIPNGINLKIKKTEKIDIRKYNIPKNKKLLLFVGRMSFEKRVNILLKSMKYLEDEDVFLALVGSGPYLKKYKELAKKIKLKNVKFFGYVKDEILYSIYNSADIFVSPSDSEVHPMTFLEAMAFGLPIIGVNKCGAKDVIKDGFNGFVAKPRNSVDLAVKITKLISNEKLIEKFSNNSKKMIKQYSIENTGKKLLELYKKLL